VRGAAGNSGPCRDHRLSHFRSKRILTTLLIFPDYSTVILTVFPMAAA
jgi:hypothetical protein